MPCAHGWRKTATARRRRASTPVTGTTTNAIWQVLGRSPQHVLLLHSNAINAEWLGDVVAAFRDAGWEFVSPERAYRDPLYALTPQNEPAGESIVWALAKEQGLPGLRYPAEDSRYEQATIDCVISKTARPIVHKGKPAARLVPLANRGARIRLGLAKGRYVIDDLGLDDGLIAQFFQAGTDRPGRESR